MKIFAIRNEADSDRTAGFLFYYEKPGRFYIELPEKIDEWEAPLLLSSFIKRGRYTVGSHWSKIWVQQRIVPPDRQNLPSVLKDNGLGTYDEFGLLMLSMGRCAQDDYYLAPVSFEELPEEIQKRRSHGIEDVVPLENNKLLVFFSNGIIKICDINRIVDSKAPLRVLLDIYPQALEKVRLQVGGYGVYWDENMMISDSDLYESGKTVPLSKDDFLTFVSKRVVNTSEAAEILGCSRQNIEDLIKRGKLKAIKESGKNKLFLKSDIEKREWK